MKRAFLFLSVSFFLGAGNEIFLSSVIPGLRAELRSTVGAKKVMPRGTIMLKNTDWSELMTTYEDLLRISIYARKNDEIVLRKLDVIWNVYERNPDIFVLFFESVYYGCHDLLTVDESIDDVSVRKKEDVSILIFDFLEFKNELDSIYFKKKEDGSVQYNYWRIQIQGDVEKHPLIGDYLRCFFIKKPSGERALNKIEAEGFIRLHDKKWMILEESYEALIELDISQKKNGPLVDQQLAKILDVFERGENMFILFFQCINLNCNGEFSVSEKIDKADVNKKIEIALLVFEFLDYNDGKNSCYFNKDGMIIHESYNLQKERNAQESCPIGLELRERIRKSSMNKYGG